MISTEFCYDFPEVILHKTDCPRHTGVGVCHPLPTPTEPYTPDEALAVKGYEELIVANGLQGKSFGNEDLLALPDMEPVRQHGKTGSVVGQPDDPRVADLMALGIDHEEALRVCRDPDFLGVRLITFEDLVELIENETRRERLS